VDERENHDTKDTSADNGCQDNNEDVDGVDTLGGVRLGLKGGLGGTTPGQANEGKSHEGSGQE
jgi:hypothetical protein